MLGSRNTPIIYDSQNVELRQKKELLSPWPQDYQAIIDVERQCLHRCAKVVACAESDIEAFGEDYGVPAYRCALVPNGADVINAPRLTEEDRVASRARLGFQDRFVCVFAGSDHFPNLRGRTHRGIRQLWRECLFILFGGVSEYLTEIGPVPPNVLGLGVINEAQKWLVLGCCDLALNPMERGSGSNIKMFEFAAAKLPILSTPFGAVVPGLRGQRFPGGGYRGVRGPHSAAAEVGCGRVDVLWRKRPSNGGRALRLDRHWREVRGRRPQGDCPPGR